jgi:hypothetical protein
MGELLGIGMTHGPMFQFPDENMADILRRDLMKKNVPQEMRDPLNWPVAMREEWGSDEGLRAARQHRQDVVGAFRRIRSELEEFNPDFVLVWGDDQYENFREDIVPAFCVYIYDELECLPYANSPSIRARTNVWNQPPDKVITMRGHQEAAGFLTRELLASDFDVAYAFKPHHHPSLAHAFMRTLVYTDYDQEGFRWPMIPFHVNCYGSAMIDRAQNASSIIAFPPAPSPRRCYDLGKAVGDILHRSDYRAAVIGSSSWSHAFLTEKHHRLYPDVETDRMRFNELQKGEQSKWRDLSLEDLTNAGEHEMLNWICLAGAMEGRKPDYAEMAETYIFNSTKVSAIFRP